MESLQLTETSYVILGTLTFREMSGYELKSVLDKSIRHFYISPAQSRIYAELRRLESHDLLTMRRVFQEQRPDKRMYRITPKGRALVQEWLELGKIPPDAYKSSFQLRLFFGHLLSRERLLSIIGNQRRWLVETIVLLEDRAENLQSRMQGNASEDELIFPLMALELKLATFRAELAWADRALMQIKQWQPKETQRGANEDL